MGLENLYKLGRSPCICKYLILAERFKPSHPHWWLEEEMRIWNLLAAAELALAGPLVEIDWASLDAPKSGLESIDFPLGVLDSAHVEAYTYGQTFEFVGGPLGHYGSVAVEPWPLVNGSSYVLAVYEIVGVPGILSNSSYAVASNSTSYSSVKYAEPFKVPYNHTLNLGVVEIAPGEWAGYVADPVANTSATLGSIILPNSSTGIAPKSTGFVEYSLSGSSAGSIPYTDAFFGLPSSGNYTFVLQQPKAVGPYASELDFATNEVGDGYVLTVGYPNASFPVASANWTNSTTVGGPWNLTTNISSWNASSTNITNATSFWSNYSAISNVTGFYWNFTNITNFTYPVGANLTNVTIAFNGTNATNLTTLLNSTFDILSLLNKTLTGSTDI